mgnify:CR=1 FL=1
MSQLKVNSIVPVGGLPSGSNGGIIQIVSASKTDTSSFNTTTGTTASLESIFPISITPSTSSAKVLIRFVLTVGLNTNATVTADLCRKIGSGSETIVIVGDADGSRSRITFGSPTINAHNVSTLNVEFIDSPATTSACKYYLKLGHMSGDSRDFFLNRSNVDSNDASYARGICYATAMEVTV